MSTYAPFFFAVAAALFQGSALAQTQINLDSLDAALDFASGRVLLGAGANPPVIASGPPLAVDGVTLTGGSLLRYPSAFDPYQGLTEDPHNIYASSVTKEQQGDGTYSWRGWPGSQQTVNHHLPA